MYRRAYLLSMPHKRTSGRCRWGRLWEQENTRFKNLAITPYLYRIRYLYRSHSRPSYLSLLCSTFMVRTTHRYLYRKVRGRFGRFSKPFDHLGNINPEEFINVTQIVEEFPKTGAIFKDMDIFIK